MFFKFNCGRSCHFLLRSFFSNDPASILSFQRHCDVSLFDPLSRFAKIMFFPCLSILPECCSLFSSPFLLIKLCFSFLPECCPNSFLFSFLIYLVSPRVVSNSCLFLKPFFNSLQPSRFVGYTRLSKKQLSFTSSTSPSVSFLRSRVEIFY